MDFFLSIEVWVSIGLAFVFYVAGIGMLLTPEQLWGLSRKPWEGAYFTIIFGSLYLCFGMLRLLNIHAIGFTLFMIIVFVIVGSNGLVFALTWGSYRQFKQKIFPPISDSEIQALVSQGKKLEAIKRVVQSTRMNLMDAKHYVESLESKNNT